MVEGLGRPREYQQRPMRARVVHRRAIVQRHEYERLSFGIQRVQVHHVVAVRSHGTRHARMHEQNVAIALEQRVLQVLEVKLYDLIVYPALAAQQIDIAYA